MDRPKIICHMMTSLDGKVTGSFLELPQARLAEQHYSSQHRAFGAQAFAAGRITMEQSYMDDEYPDLAPFLDATVPAGDYIADRDCPMYAIAFDRKGRIGWKHGYIKDDEEGYNGAHIIEVVTGDAQSTCLAYLRSIGVSYIYADTIDEAMHKLRKAFDIKLLLLEGGSELNAAFLAEDLVDEISLVQVPVLADTKSKALFQSSEVRACKLVSQEAKDDGTMLLRYSVIRS